MGTGSPWGSEDGHKASKIHSRHRQCFPVKGFEGFGFVLGQIHLKIVHLL